MKWTLVAALVSVVVQIRPADACGVKLTVKSTTPRKSVAHASNPGEILLVGTPPRRLERDLSAAGHRVEVVPNASAAKRKSYAIVVVDSAQQTEARERFAGSVVVVRSGDIDADLRSVEKQVARRPVRADEGRTVVSAREGRSPIAAGPEDDATRRRVVAARVQEPVAEPVPVVAQPVVKVATVKPNPEPTPKVAVVKPVPEPTPKVAVVIPTPEPKVKPPVAEVRTTVVTPAVEPKQQVSPSRAEVYFGISSASANQASLAKVLRSLNDRSDLQITIEGHADPTGSPEANLALAQKRAEWVRDFLVSSGIDQSRLEVISYGDTRLKYGRVDHRNRRVAIVPK